MGIERIFRAAEAGDSYAILSIALASALTLVSTVLSSVIAKIYRDWRADRAAHTRRDDMWADKMADVSKILAEILGRVETQGAMVLASLVASRRRNGSPPES